MKRSVLWLVCLVGVMAVSASAQAPSVFSGGVVNAASFAPVGLPNSSIAQGSIFIVFGQNMGPATLTTNSGFPLPTTLPASNGTSIKVTVGSTTVSAFMVYTSAGQLAAILPSNTPAGAGTLTVTYNGQTSAGVPVTIVSNSVGIFAANQGGSGPGVVTNAATQPSNPTNAANPGETNVIWATGLGPISGGNDGSGPSPGNMPNLPVKVFVGGAQAQVSYQGRSGCCAGLDQINFTVPSGVNGCYVPVYITVTSGTTTVVSNTVTMSIAGTGRVCSDTNGYSASDILKLNSQGSLSIGAVSLVRTSTTTTVPGFGTLSINNDIGSAGFYKYDTNAFLQNGAGQSSVLGSCIVSTFKSGSGSGAMPGITQLDAGASISINGPNGVKALTKTQGAAGLYSAILGGGGIPGIGGGSPDYLSAGSYTATGPGGANVGAFTAQLTLPQPLTWTNQSSTTTVVRASGQTVTWSGGGSNGYVYIYGSSSLSSGTGALFICTAQASAGQFKIPAEVLLALPPTPSGSSSGFLSVGFITNPSTFTASGLDFGSMISEVLTSQTVSYQ